MGNAITGHCAVKILANYLKPVILAYESRLDGRRLQRGRKVWASKGKVLGNA